MLYREFDNPNFDVIGFWGNPLRKRRKSLTVSKSQTQARRILKNERGECWQRHATGGKSVKESTGQKAVQLRQRLEVKIVNACMTILILQSLRPILAVHSRVRSNT